MADIDGSRENKPRRLEEHDEIITYLCSLDEQLSREGLDASDFEVLVDNVLSEIKSRAASAASDRKTNSTVEKLILVATVTQLLTFMKLFTPYVVFLSRNRFSSHLMQSVLARLGYLLKSNAGYGSGSIDDELIASTSLEFVSPLFREFNWLAKDTCASHVLRSCICLLAGIPCIAEKKGKASKHTHSVAYSQLLESLLEQGTYFVSKSSTFPVPDDFHEMLGSSAAALMEIDDDTALSLLTDSSSCAVLSLLFRVMYSPDLVMGGPELAERVVQHLMQWKGGPNPDDVASDADIKSPLERAQQSCLFYSMAGDRAASHALEVIIECCSVPLLCSVLRAAMIGVTSAYAADDTGNFVVQAVLRRLAQEIPRETVSGASDKSKKKAITKSPVYEVSELLLVELLDENSFEATAARKGGVVLWMLDVAAALMQRYTKSGSRSIGCRVANALLAVWAKLEGHSDIDMLQLFTSRLSKRAAVANDVEGASSTKPAVKSRYPPPAAKNAFDDRDAALLLNARMVGNLIKLAPLIDNGEAIFDAVSRLPSSILVELASTGLTSRSIFDSFFEHCKDSTHLKQLVRTLEPSVGDLSVHHAGQHVFRQLFGLADIEDKELLVSALEPLKTKLAASKEGRNSLRIVHMDLWVRQPAEWRSQAKRHSQAQNMLLELESVTLLSPVGKGFDSQSGSMDTDPSTTIVEAKASLPPTATQLLSVATESEAKNPSRKRKRKRPAAKGKHSAFDDSDDDGEAGASGRNENNSAREVAASVDVVSSPEPVKVSPKVQNAQPVAFQPQSVVTKLAILNSKRRTSSEKPFHEAGNSSFVHSKRPASSSSPSVDMKKIADLKSGKLLSAARLIDEIKILESEKKPKEK